MSSGFLDRLRDALRYPLFPIGDQMVTPSTLLVVVVVLLVTYWVSRLVQRGIRRIFEHRDVADRGTTELVVRAIHYGIMVAGLGIALQTVGIQLATLFASFAIFAIALGFAMQNIAENFVSGLILLGERSIKPGDLLEVDNIVIRVQHMGIRATIGRTRDEEDLIIPNSKLVQGTVKNYTMRDHVYRLRAQVGVSYESDLRQVMQVLQDAIDGVEWRMEEPRPSVVLERFGDSSVDFEVRVWADDPWSMPSLRSRLYQTIWFAFQDAGITIAYPQLDVHVDTELLSSISGGKRDAL